MEFERGVFWSLLSADTPIEKVAARVAEKTADHPRTRLPSNEVRKRLTAWEKL